MNFAARSADERKFKVRLASALICVLLSGALPRWSHAEVDAQAFADIVHRGMTMNQIPGLAVAVIDGGELIYAESLGVASLDSETPVSNDTYFVNASTTKAMVSAALMLLADENKVTLNDLLIDHLPHIHFANPELTATLTLKDLLTHRTGLPSTDFWTFNQGMPLADQLPRLREVDAIAPVRSRKIYQNTMYELIGLVIERVSGQPWDEFLRDRLWRPIGMGSVATRDAIPEGARQVSPYELIGGALKEVNHSLRGSVGDAAGSAWSSLDDMVLWAQFLLRGGITANGERLLSAAAIDEVFRPQQLIDTRDYNPTAALTAPNWISYGLGWYQQDFQGRKIDFHTGSLNGSTAMVGLDRARGRAMIMLANRGGAELRHALLWAVMDERDFSAQPDWVSDVLDLYDARAASRRVARETLNAGRLDRSPSLPLGAYTGRYVSARGGPLEVRLDTEGLTLHTQVRSYRLSPWHTEIFELMHEDWSTSAFASFSLTPQGSVDAIEAFGLRFERAQ